MNVLGPAHRAIDRKRDNRNARDEAEDRDVDQFLSPLGSALTAAYQVHLFDGRPIVATLPATNAGPDAFYQVRGESWRVVAHSARHDEGPDRYAWIVRVQRRSAVSGAA